MIDSGSDLTVGRPHQLHEPPASAASLEQVDLDDNYWLIILIYHLSYLVHLSESQLPLRQRVIISQHQVPATVLE